MSRSIRKLSVAVLTVALATSLVVVGLPGADLASQHDGPSQDTTYLRVVHASPDAPAVDVYVENETVLENVSFGSVSDYLELQAGSYNVTITAAGDEEAVVFDDTVNLSSRQAVTLAASGEITEGEFTEPFEPVFFEDDAFAPGDDESAISIVHLSPDAPAVDVTTTAGGNTTVLAENVTFQNGSDYVTVPAGDYTVDIRAATEDNNGSIVASVDVSLAGGTAYTAWAVGYLNPEEAAADTPFGVVLSEDARTTISLPGEETNETATPTDEMGTDTETETETETDTETDTETETDTASAVSVWAP